MKLKCWPNERFTCAPKIASCCRLAARAYIQPALTLIWVS
jgi:hypothetical protein